jgi:hypothetical protein
MSEFAIKEHMDVIGADGVHVGTVDRVEKGRVKLTKADSGEGKHKGHHHYICLSLVAEVEGQRVRLSATLRSLSRWKRRSLQRRHNRLGAAVIGRWKTFARVAASYPEVLGVGR